MYNLSMQSTENKEPWATSFSVRKNAFYNYKKQGKKLILMVYEQPDGITFRYRGYNISKVLNDSDSEYRAVYFFYDEIEYIYALVPQSCYIDLIRVYYSPQIARICDIAKHNGVKVGLEVDDLAYDPDYLPLLMNTLNVDIYSATDYDFWFSRVSKLAYTAKFAEVYRCTNPYLAKCIKDKFGKQCEVIPNFLNKEQVDYSEELRKEKFSTPNDGRFIIGYFSGTNTHINDFKVVYKDILALLKKYDNIYVNVVGCIQLPKEMEPYLLNNRIIFTPFVDYLTLQKLIAQVDVNIVPLVDNTFTNCKSELKYFEAAMVNTLTCATPTYTFAHAIEHGVNGFLCHQLDWFDCLEQIYLNQEKMKTIAQRAYEDVKKRYFGINVENQIIQCYDNLVKGNNNG